MAERTLTRSEAVRIAKDQRWVLWCLVANFMLNLMYFLLGAAGGTLPEMGNVLVNLAVVMIFGLYTCSLIPAQVFFVYQLASSLGSRIAVL